MNIIGNTLSSLLIWV